MQKWMYRAALLCAAGQFVWSAGASSAQTLGPRQVVFEGDAYNLNDPNNAPVVNEPNIAFSKVDGQASFIAIWQVGKVPGVNDIEVPFGLDYSIGEYNVGTRQVMWGPRKHVPLPANSLDARDPAIVRMPNATEGFIGAGVRRPLVTLEDFGFSVRSDPQDPGTLDFPQPFDDIQIGWPRLDRAIDGSQFGLPTMLVAQSVDPLMWFKQVIVHYTTNDGVGWTNWTPVIDEASQSPIFGIPSKPAFAPDVSSFFLAYMDDQASYVRVARGEYNDTTGPDLLFFDSTLNIVPVLNVPGGQNYFDVAKNYVGGQFQIGPFADVAVTTGPNNTHRVYVVYHDLAGEPQGGDGDFDVFLVRGDWNPSTQQFSWTAPLRVNQDNPHKRSDQFMPAVAVDGIGRVHVAWYDTRHHKVAPGQDVVIGLYYASIEEDQFGQMQVTELLCDDQAIKSWHLRNEKSIGDRIDIAVSSDNASVVVVYTGTAHPRNQPPIGIESLDGPIATQDDELIVSQRIDW